MQARCRRPRAPSAPQSNRRPAAELLLHRRRCRENLHRACRRLGWQKSPVCRLQITDDRSGRAGLDAVTAACAALKKGRFGDGSRGRNQSVLTGAAGCSRAHPRSENSRAALATETTESFRKSRRPYLGSPATMRSKLHHTVGLQFIDFDATVAGPHTRHPSPDDSRE